MGWMKILYEKFKPYFGIIVIGFIAYSVVSGILGTHRQDEYTRTLKSTIGNLKLVSDELGGVISNVSSLEEGISGLTETTRDLRELGTELRDTSNRLEKSILELGDESTESGLKADRLYRISRELAKRESENSE